MEKGEIGYRALREAGSKAIEDAFTKAICELTGEDYKVEVSTLDFEPSDGAWMWDRTKITVVAQRKNDFTFGVTATSEEESTSPS